MKLARCSFRVRLAIRECQFLSMAAGAGFLAIRRYSLVVKKVAAQFDLGRVHRVVRRNSRARERLWNVPIEGARLSQQAGRHNEREKCDALHAISIITKATSSQIESVLKSSMRW